MTIERKVFAPEQRSVARPEPATCLDCPDCQGLCWSAAELRRVPEYVLHHGREARP
ncbi:MAG: hypothetical protein JJT95_04845 [Pararhodobacter sp.]|nr:hypothetical protein [Pararhodobacter sp.]